MIASGRFRIFFDDPLQLLFCFQEDDEDGLSLSGQTPTHFMTPVREKIMFISLVNITI